MAPGAHLVVLKALDVTGNGFTSNVIAAIDYAIANRATYNIRVLNLSVAAGVYESFTKDPLTLAAKRAVDAGIVVVAAAGNRGRDRDGPAAVRRDRVARQRAVGADGRRDERSRHDRSPRRCDGRVQLARTGANRREREARSRGARRQYRVDGGSVERALRGESDLATVGRGRSPGASRT